MNSADGPVHLEPQQVSKLDQALADCRHNVNNSLSMIISALELMQFKPDAAARMIETAVNHTKVIGQEMEKYSAVFDQTLKPANSGQNHQ